MSISLIFYDVYTPKSTKVKFNEHDVLYLSDEDVAHLNACLTLDRLTYYDKSSVFLRDRNTNIIYCLHLASELRLERHETLLHHPVHGFLSIVKASPLHEKKKNIPIIDSDDDLAMAM